MTISIEMSKSKKEQAENYAIDKDTTLREAIKKVYFEAIEDEFGIATTNEALKEYKKENKTISLCEMERKLKV